jgi:hypothetical protein
LKRIALLAVIGAGLLALPSSAAAQSGAANCPGGVEVSASGACVYVEAPVTGADVGGELVLNAGGCSYINGWTTNPGTPGYAGLCTLAPHDAGCGPDDEGSGANTGGCFWIKPLPVDQTALQNPVTDMFICGNTSGEDPQASGRDGCKIP